MAVKKAINDIDYQSKPAVREVLGCIMQCPGLLATHPLEKSDFPELYHKLIFSAVNGLYCAGAQKITAPVVREYLEESSATFFKIYSNNGGDDYVTKALAGSDVENFERNYLTVRKFSALRMLKNQGIDVSDVFDPYEIDPVVMDKQRALFNKMSIEELVLYYRQKVLDTMSHYSPRSGRNSVKAGGEAAKAQKELWKTTPSFGLSYASNFQTTITKGMRPKKFSVSSAGTGMGKSRLSVANICHSFVPKYWDEEKQAFVKNPHGEQNAVLYIGTEMELVEEVEPILWAYVANVPEEHITEAKYLPGEEERVNKAIEIIDSGHIYLEYVPDYDIAKLEEIIEEHIIKHNVRHVYFDYIHITTELIGEFQDAAKAHMTIREDQVLANVSTKLKDLCNKYDISIDTWTQLSGNWKDESVRDQTIVRGSRAIIDKADVASITSAPLPTELKKLETVTKTAICFGKPTPNVCMTFYKNRSSPYKNVKVWLYVDYSTMRVHDLFCTDLDCKLLDDIPQTYTQIEEDKIVVVNDKENIVLAKANPFEGIVVEEDGMKTIELEENTANFFPDDDEKTLAKINKGIEKMDKEKGKIIHFETIKDMEKEEIQKEKEAQKAAEEKAEEKVIETVSDEVEPEERICDEIPLNDSLSDEVPQKKKRGRPKKVVEAVETESESKGAEPIEETKSESKEIEETKSEPKENKETESEPVKTKTKKESDSKEEEDFDY